jgi:hypothetical protein
MNFKKIVAAVAAAALALSAFAFSASAVDSYTVSAIVKEATTWNDTTTKIDVTGNGTYTVSVDVSATGADTFGYLWLMGYDKASDDYANATLTVDSVKFDGVEQTITNPTYPFLMPKTAPIMGEHPMFNVWNADDAPAIDLSGATKLDGTGYQFPGADGTPLKIGVFEVTFTISGVGEAAPAADAGAATTAPATGNTPIAIIGGIAVAGLIGTVVSRKRK